MIDPGRLLADGFSTVTTRSPRRLRELAMRTPVRTAVSDQIIRGMAREFIGERAGELDAVIAWEVGDPGDAARWYLTIAEGRCRTSRRAPQTDPRLTFKLDHLTLLELAAGIANGPQMFMAGRIRIEGDLMLAQRMTTLFRIPGTPR